MLPARAVTWGRPWTRGRRRRVTVTVIPELEPIGRVLTAEEYDALPENPRRELVDGVIQMMASPTFRHQSVKEALYMLLRRHRPDDVAVLAEVEIRLKPLLRRIPDIV